MDEEFDNDAYFPKSVYLGVLKKTATAKKAFEKINDFLNARERKLANQREVERVKFEKRQTIYRFDTRK